MIRLHYLYDPLCGWCYAAAPLLDALVTRFPDWPIELHAGGLFSQRRITPDLVDHIRRHDARIGQLSGQPFGEPYLNGLLEAGDLWLDSAAVTAAILAVEHQDPALAVPMLQSIHRAHYQQGLRVVERQTQADLAKALGVTNDSFEAAMATVTGRPTADHIENTRRLMARVGAQGFPTFVLQRGDALRVLDHANHYGQPEAFVEAVNELAEDPVLHP